MPGPREMKCNSLRNKKVTKLIVSQLKQLAEASQASFGKVQVQSVTYGESPASTGQVLSCDPWSQETSETQALGWGRGNLKIQHPAMKVDLLTVTITLWVMSCCPYKRRQ